MSVRLSRAARSTLREAGLSERDWAQHHHGTETWRGDVCGCPDDRCRDGYHHELDEDCGCLPSSIDFYFHERGEGGHVAGGDGKCVLCRLIFAVEASP